MWATPTAAIDRLLGAVWISFAAFNVTLMWVLPGQETVPFHFVWISLALVYGFTSWRMAWMVLALIGVTVSTGLILAHHAAVGEIRWEETAEEPLMAAIFIVMVWHVHRRQLLLREVHRIHDAEREREEHKQLFVRLASHELRTPLTVARGYTELLRTARGDAESAEDFAIVLDELDKAARITSRLVTLIQLDQPHQVTSVDLDAELLRIRRRWEPTADRAWSSDSAIGWARCNPERMEAAIDCLIENAIKFTRPGDRIEVIGRRVPSGWTVEVADSGPGIPPADVPELLAGAPGRTTPTGTGLGLTIVRAVAVSLDGRLTVDAAPGGGARVGVWAPQPQQVPDPAASAPPPPDRPVDGRSEGDRRAAADRVSSGGSGGFRRPGTTW